MEALWRRVVASSGHARVTSQRFVLARPDLVLDALVDFLANGVPPRESLASLEAEAGAAGAEAEPEAPDTPQQKKSILGWAAGLTLGALRGVLHLPAAQTPQPARVVHKHRKGPRPQTQPLWYSGEGDPAALEREARAVAVMMIRAMRDVARDGSRVCRQLQAVRMLQAVAANDAARVAAGLRGAGNREAAVTVLLGATDRQSALYRLPRYLARMVFGFLRYDLLNERCERGSRSDGAVLAHDVAFAGLRLVQQPSYLPGGAHLPTLWADEALTAAFGDVGAELADTVTAVLAVPDAALGPVVAHNDTLLHVACRQCAGDVVAVLLDNGARRTRNAAGRLPSAVAEPELLRSRKLRNPLAALDEAAGRLRWEVGPVAFPEAYVSQCCLEVNCQPLLTDGRAVRVTLSLRRDFAVADGAFELRVYDASGVCLGLRELRVPHPSRSAIAEAGAAVVHAPVEPPLEAPRGAFVALARPAGGLGTGTDLVPPSEAMRRGVCRSREPMATHERYVVGQPQTRYEAGWRVDMEQSTGGGVGGCGLG